jgi:chemotaxis protein histidine kinase CheA
VKRLGPGRIDVSSELGVGTEISVTLPIDFIGPDQTPTTSFPFNLGSVNRPQHTARRIISTELDKLFSDASSIIPPAQTDSADVHSTTSQPPSFSEPPLVDFPAAVAALHTTLSAVPRAQMDSNEGPDELAIEAAKLAIAATQRVESSVIPMSSPNVVADKAEDPLKTKEEEDKKVQTATVEPKVEAKVVEKKVQEHRKSSIAPDVHVLFADDNPVARNILIKLFTGKVSAVCIRFSIPLI